MSNLTSDLQTYIDTLSFEQLLKISRFTAPGDAIFSGDAGEYFADRLALFQRRAGPDEAAAASLRVGFPQSTPEVVLPVEEPVVEEVVAEDEVPEVVPPVE